MIFASQAQSGSVYRRTKKPFCEQFRGYRVLVPMTPQDASRVLMRMRAGKQDSRETFCLSCVRDGTGSAWWRYIRLDRTTTREVVIIPNDCRLRVVVPPTWLPKSRKGGAR